ncbi:MAG TPA: hypothetical protein VKU80_15455 [Planctomycetota bacterium]|nr:hypothetical protein [Planctomycetota bacterium]
MKTLAQVKRIVRRILETDEDDPGFVSGVLLFSAATLRRTGVKPLARFTGYPRSVVEPRIRRLRENGVFRGRKVHAGWADPKTGGIAFICDTMIADGLLRRAKA